MLPYKIRWKAFLFVKFYSTEAFLSQDQFIVPFKQHYMDASFSHKERQFSALSSQYVWGLGTTLSLSVIHRLTLYLRKRQLVTPSLHAKLLTIAPYSNQPLLAIPACFLDLIKKTNTHIVSSSTFAEEMNCVLLIKSWIILTLWVRFWRWVRSKFYFLTWYQSQILQSLLVFLNVGHPRYIIHALVSSPRHVSVCQISHWLNVWVVVSLDIVLGNSPHMS